MDWIKKNFEKFALLLLSLALLGTAVFLVISAKAFLANFATLNERAASTSKVPPLDTKAVDEAQAELQKPAMWGGHPGSLFVSRRYVVISGALVDPLESDKNIHDPVPNKWFTDHGLDNEILDSDVLAQDPDGDGFTNLDEFNGKTDPQDKNSHPAYTTKLRLKKFIKVPFRLVFKARPDNDSFQIDTLDVRQPSQILKQGDQIAGTKFKIVKFEEKHAMDANGVDLDVSELTVQNTETGAQVVLVLEKTVDSPDSYALFKYLWDNTELTVKKDGEFSLKPETDIKYKVIDITDKEALIQNLKTNEKIEVPALEQQNR